MQLDIFSLLYMFSVGRRLAPDARVLSFFLFLHCQNSRQRNDNIFDHISVAAERKNGRTLFAPRTMYLPDYSERHFLDWRTVCDVIEGFWMVLSHHAPLRRMTQNQVKPLQFSSTGAKSVSLSIAPPLAPEVSG